MMDPDEIQSGSTILLPFMIKNSSASAIFASWDDGGVFSIPYLSRQNKSRQNKVTQGWHVKKPKKLTHCKTNISIKTHSRQKITRGKQINSLQTTRSDREPTREGKARAAARAARSGSTAGSSVSGGSHVISGWSAVVISGKYKYSYMVLRLFKLLLSRNSQKRLARCVSLGKFRIGFLIACVAGVRRGR